MHIYTYILARFPSHFVEVFNKVVVEGGGEGGGIFCNGDISGGGELGKGSLTLCCMLLKQMFSVLGHSSQPEQRSRASIFQRTDKPINS